MCSNKTNLPQTVNPYNGREIKKIQLKECHKCLHIVGVRLCGGDLIVRLSDCVRGVGRINSSVVKSIACGNLTKRV